MLENKYLDAKIGFDTAENGYSTIWQIWQIWQIGLLLLQRPAGESAPPEVGCKGKYVYSCSDDKSVRVWDISTGPPGRERIPSQDSVRQVFFVRLKKKKEK